MGVDTKYNMLLNLQQNKYVSAFLCVKYLQEN